MISYICFWQECAWDKFPTTDAWKPTRKGGRDGTHADKPIYQVLCSTPVTKQVISDPSCFFSTLSGCDLCSLLGIFFNVSFPYLGEHELLIGQPMVYRRVHGYSWKV